MVQTPTGDRRGGRPEEPRSTTMCPEAYGRRSDGAGCFRHVGSSLHLQVVHEGSWPLTRRVGGLAALTLTATEPGARSLERVLAQHSLHLVAARAGVIHLIRPASSNYTSRFVHVQAVARNAIRPSPAGVRGGHRRGLAMRRRRRKRRPGRERRHGRKSRMRTCESKCFPRRRPPESRGRDGRVTHKAEHCYRLLTETATSSASLFLSTPER